VNVLIFVYDNVAWVVVEHYLEKFMDDLKDARVLLPDDHAFRHPSNRVAQIPAGVPVEHLELRTAREIEDERKAAKK
jgi:hypothetical protein